MADDTTPKRVLIILKAKPISLRSAENFLKNRNWDVFSTTDVKTSLPAILSGKASYVILTVEHANPNVMKLQQIINHTLKIPIIYFAEGLSPQGPATLNELKYPYVIYPPVSGPAIERMIHKIERDQRLAEETNDSVAGEMMQMSSGSDKFVAESGKAREELAKIFGGDASKDFEFFSHQKGSSGEFAIQQSAKPATPVPSVVQSGIHSSAHAAKQEGATGEDVRAYLSGENNSTPSIHGESDVFGKKKGLGKSIIVGLDKPKAKKDESSAKRVSGPANVVPAGTKSLVLPGKVTGDTDSILIQGAQHALDKVVKPPDEVKHVLGISTRLHCFFVQSEKFRGYVLVAYAQNTDLEQKFKHELHKTFLHFIRAAGLKIEIKDSTDISIIEVDFEDWSMSESEFLVKSVHEGAEIAVTFFPADEHHNVIEPSKDGKMLQVPVQDIEEGVPLDFDLYLYMPTNNKYFHYTKKNGSITKEQKERLLNSNKAHLHVLPEAKDKVASYRTSKFVNEKILSHKKKKAS